LRSLVRSAIVIFYGTSDDLVAIQFRHELYFAAKEQNSSPIIFRCSESSGNGFESSSLRHLCYQFGQAGYNTKTVATFFHSAKPNGGSRRRLGLCRPSRA
jgi:hypothetical protein